MKKKYDNIQQLITYWQEFETENPDLDISCFGNWLSKMQADESSSSSMKAARGDTIKQDKNKKEPEIDTRQRFLELISRLSRLQDFYTKKLFEGLPLNNLLEFNFLFSLNKQRSLKKKEIIDYNLVEYTTGIDIIKRLIRLQLVSEFPDQLDKRSKRLKITSEGKRVLIDALIVINRIGHLFFDNHQEDHWEFCLQNLTKLEAYHKKIFTKGNTSSGYEILKIIQTNN